jgi:hypothetical protein
VAQNFLGGVVFQNRIGEIASAIHGEIDELKEKETVT